MKHIFTLTVVLLATFSTLNAQQSEIDSLTIKLGEKLADTSRVNTLNELSKYYWRISPDTSVMFGKEALELSKKTNYRKGQANALSRIGSGNYHLGNYKVAIKYSEDAIAIYKELGLDNFLLSCFSNIGIAYNDLEDYVKAEEYLLKSLAIARSIGDKRREAVLLYNIGWSAESRGDFSVALPYLIEALEKSEKENFPQITSRALSILGDIYLQKKEYEQSIKYLNRSLELARKQNDITAVSNDLILIANAYQDQGKHKEAIRLYNESLEYKIQLNHRLDEMMITCKIANSYRALNKYDNALSHLNKAFFIVKELDYPIDSYWYYSSIDRLLYEMKKYDGALANANKSLEFAEKSENKEKIRTTTELLYEIHEALGDNKNALKYHKLYKTYADSAFTIEKEKEINRLTLIRERLDRKTLEKDNILKGEQLLLRNKEIEYGKSREKMIAAIALLLSAFLFAIMISRRKIKQANRELRTSQEELLEKNEEIKTQSVKLKEANDKISSINENLEVIVQRRTLELLEKNKQLDDYTFINAHKLRAPVARILGLASLMNLTDSNKEIRKIMGLTKTEAEELDKIIKTIRETLEE